MDILDLLAERTTLDAATAVSRGQEDVARPGEAAVVGEVGPVTTHTCFTAVEQRRLCQVVCVFEPVPVWLVALVAAFFAKCCLVGIGYIAMPGQEVALCV